MCVSHRSALAASVLWFSSSVIVDDIKGLSVVFALPTPSRSRASLISDCYPGFSPCLFIPVSWILPCLCFSVWRSPDLVSVVWLRFCLPVLRLCLAPMNDLYALCYPCILPHLAFMSVFNIMLFSCWNNSTLLICLLLRILYSVCKWVSTCERPVAIGTVAYYNELITVKHILRSGVIKELPVYTHVLEVCEWNAGKMVQDLRLKELNVKESWWFR